MVRYLFALILLCSSVAHAVEPLPSRTMVRLGEVDWENTDLVAKELTRRAESGEPLVLLNLDSPGGSVFAGLDFIKRVNDLRKLTGVRVACVVDNYAFSMASVILETVCDVRLATPHALVLFHSASTTIDGNAEHIASELAFLRQMDHALATMVAPRLGLSVKAYEAKVKGKDWTMAADAALAAGVIDGIVQAEDLPPSITPVSPAPSLTFGM